MGCIEKHPIVIRCRKGQTVQPSKCDHLMVERGTGGNITVGRSRRGNQGVEIGTQTFNIIVKARIACVIDISIRVWTE